MTESFWSIRIEERTAVVARTTRRVEDPKAYADGFSVVFDALALLPESTRLLVDLRLAMGRNDAAFEEHVAAPRQRLLRRFPQVAILAGTQVGAMQIRRHLAQDGLDVPVFTDESEADLWCRTGD